MNGISIARPLAANEPWRTITKSVISPRAINAIVFTMLKIMPMKGMSDRSPRIHESKNPPMSIMSSHKSIISPWFAQYLPNFDPGTETSGRKKRSPVQAQTHSILQHRRSSGWNCLVCSFPFALKRILSAPFGKFRYVNVTERTLYRKKTSLSRTSVWDGKNIWKTCKKPIDKTECPCYNKSS